MDTIVIGSRVRRVRGTFIENLTGTVAMFSVNHRGDPTALVWLDPPMEPGIGSQFVCPVEHLELLPEQSPRRPTRETN